MRTPLLVVAVATLLAQAAVAGFSADLYTKVEVRELQLNVADYKNKRVSFQSPFVGVQTSFPKHVVMSGFRQDKDVRILTLLNNVAIMAKKDEEVTNLLKTLKRGDVIVVYGKVREFRTPGNREALWPKYYLDLEHIEVTNERAAATDNKPLPRRRLPPRRRPRR